MKYKIIIFITILFTFYINADTSNHNLVNQKADNNKKTIDIKFVNNEISALYEDENDNDIDYGISDFSPVDFGFSEDQTILWKQNQKKIIESFQKEKLIDKLMSIDYKRQNYPANLFKTNVRDNVHIPKFFSASDYQDFAFSCVERGDLNCIEALLSEYVKVDIRDKNGKTLLIKAVDENQIDCVRFLLNKGADFKLSDNKGNTALSIAYKKGYTNIAQDLIYMGAKK